MTLARSWRKPRYGEVVRVHACPSPSGSPICGGLVGGFARFEGTAQQVNCPKCRRSMVTCADAPEAPYGRVGA